MPETGESSLGLLNEGLERRVRTPPLCQDLLVLLPGLGSAPQPFVGGTSKQPNSSHHSPARVEAGSLER